MRPSRRSTVRAAVLLSWLAACGPKPAPKDASSGEEARAPKPIDFKALLAKEIDPQPSHDLTTPDGNITATVEASGEPQFSAGEGYIQLSAPLGDGAFMCFLYPEAKDAGEVIRAMVVSTLDKAAPEHEWVDVRGDQVNGWSYVAARANYLVQRPEGKLLGDFKIAASVRHDTTVLCMLDAPGLYGAFERTLRGFLGSLQVGSHRSAPKPLEASISRSQVPGRVVSMSRDFTTKQGKNKLSQSFGTRLSIGAEGTLVTSDDASTETYGPRGTLESGVYASSSGGQLEYNLTLTHEKKLYKVAGTVQDKPVSSEFPFEKGIMDGDAGDALVCKVRDGKLPEALIVDYSPDIDTLKPSTTVVTKHTGPEGDVMAKLQGTEGTQMFVRLDETCDMQTGTLKIGANTVELERLWHEKPKP